MTWQQQEIPSPLLDGLQEIASAIAAPGQTVETVLGTTADAINVAKSFLVGKTDPLSALFLIVLDQIQDLLNDTFGAGIYQLYVNPKEVQSLGASGETVSTSFSTGISLDPDADTIKAIVSEKNLEFKFDPFGLPLMTPGQVINHMIRSFDDTGDTKRPQFSESAEVTAYGVIVTATSINGLVSLLGPLLAILDLKPLARLLDSLVRQSTTNINLPLPTSRAPDWNDTLSLASFPILREQRDVLNKALNTAKGYVNSADDAIGDLLNIIQRKIDALLALVKQFNDLIEKIKNSTAASGAYVFNFPPQIGGNAAIQTALKDPELNKLTQNGYSAGMLFVGGGPSLAPVNTIRELLTA